MINALRILLGFCFVVFAFGDIALIAIDAGRGMEFVWAFLLGTIGMCLLVLFWKRFEPS